MTIIYPSPIFGPVHSRRLGVSLGINLLPGDGKCCSFDCIYCECGFNRDFVPHEKMPTREEVMRALQHQLRAGKRRFDHHQRLYRQLDYRCPHHHRERGSPMPK